MAKEQPDEETLSDGDLYESAVETEPEAEAEAGDKPRDDKGRFATKEQPETEVEAQPESEPEPEPEKIDHRIPLTELLNEREKRQSEQRRAEAALQELEQLRRQIQPQQQPKAPDQFVDPDGYNNYWEQRLQQQQMEFQNSIRGMQAENSLARAHDKHGEVFEKAYQAVMEAAEKGDRGPAQAAVASPNPGASIVEWYQREQTLQTVGRDPKAYAQKILDEALNNPEFLAKALEKAQGVARTQPTQKVKLPPSLNKAAAAGRADDTSDMSDATLYHHAIGRS